MFHNHIKSLKVLDEDLTDTLREIAKLEDMQKELAIEITTIVMEITTIELSETLDETMLVIKKNSYEENKNEIDWRWRYITDLKSQMRKIVRDMDTMIGDLDDDKE